MEKTYINDCFGRIESNLEHIRQRISDAAAVSGRRSEDIELMVVTKTVEPELINHAIKCGATLIGENRVQEFTAKKPYLELSGCRAHLIGHLQTNKVRQIVGQVEMIQSVDSLRLAQEIDRQSRIHDAVTRCLVEVNIGSQESKTGVPVPQVRELIYQIAALGCVKVCGLMAIPPICENDSELRRYFSKMRDMFIDIRSENIDNVTMDILSMGMSSDYAQAIEEGSTMVRVGSAVFGARVY